MEKILGVLEKNYLLEKKLNKGQTLGKFLTKL